MDDVQRNTLTALGVLLMAGALTWVLTGTGTQTSAERIVPAAAVFVIGGLLIFLAWRRPHAKEQTGVTAQGPPSGGNQFNIGQQGGTAKQNNYFNQSPQPKVTSAEVDMVNVKAPRDGLYTTNIELTIEDPYAIKLVRLWAVAPSTVMVVISNAGGGMMNGGITLAPTADGTSGALSTDAFGPFRTKVHVAARTKDPEPFVQFAVEVHGTNGIVVWSKEMSVP